MVLLSGAPNARVRALRTRITVASVLALAAPVMVSAQLTFVGGEFQVNSHTINEQRRSRGAFFPDGSFRIFWASAGAQDGGNKGVFGRRFDSAGVAQAVEFQVNAYTTGAQSEVAVATTGTGTYLVVWSSFGQDDFSNPISGGVFGGLFDSSGAPLGPQFQINSFTENNQYDPAVAADAAGNFIVAWSSYEQDLSDGGIFARRYDSAGTAQATEFQINQTTVGGQYAAAVTAEDDGDFVVTWTSFGQDGANLGVFGRRFNSLGVAQGVEFLVNSLPWASRATRRSVTTRRAARRGMGEQARYRLRHLRAAIRFDGDDWAASSRSLPTPRTLSACPRSRSKTMATSSWFGRATSARRGRCSCGGSTPLAWPRGSSFRSTPTPPTISFRPGSEPMATATSSSPGPAICRTAPLTPSSLGA